MPHGDDAPADAPQDGPAVSGPVAGILDELHPELLPDGEAPHDELPPDADEPDWRGLDAGESEDDPGGLHAEVGEALDADVLHELTVGGGAAASAGDLLVETPPDGLGAAEPDGSAEPDEAAAAGAPAAAGASAAAGGAGASAESAAGESELGLVLITVVPLLEKPALRSSRSIAAAAAASVPMGSCSGSPSASAWPARSASPDSDAPSASALPTPAGLAIGLVSDVEASFAAGLEPDGDEDTGGTLAAPAPASCEESAAAEPPGSPEALPLPSEGFLPMSVLVLPDLRTAGSSLGAAPPASSASWVTGSAWLSTRGPPVKVLAPTLSATSHSWARDSRIVAIVTLAPHSETMQLAG